MRSTDGAYRVTGNGEDVWDRAAAPVDLDVADSDGEVLAVEDPHFFLEDYGDDRSVARMVFVDQGVIRAASSLDALESWGFETPLLQPSEGWDSELGGPAMVISGATWYLFYDGASGGDHAAGADGESEEGAEPEEGDEPDEASEAAE